MKFDLHKPCEKCPFRSDKIFNLRKGRMAGIIHSLIDLNEPFPCHLTVESMEYDETYGDEEDNETPLDLGTIILQAMVDVDDPDYVPTPDKVQQCGGALILLAKVDRLWYNALFRYAAYQKVFDPEQLDLTAPVYDSIEECITSTESL